MALRIYAIGLVQFLIVAGVLEAARHVWESQRRAEIAAQMAAAEQQAKEQGRPLPGPPWQAQGRYVAEGLARVIDDRPALEREVARLAEAFQWSVDVRDPDGALLAHADPSSGRATGASSTAPIVMHDGRTARLELWTRAPHGGPPHGGPPPLGGPPPPFGGPPDHGPDHGPPPPGAHPPGGGPPHPPPPVFPLGMASILVLIVVGVSSWLTARSLARPLANLSVATRAFGKGELDARARMDRADEIGEVAQAFDDMADRIAALLLAERELLANVSHELRTPLARIRVALDLASEADPAAAVQSFADIAQDLAELERIVDDVLASARLALDGPRSGAPSLLVRSEGLDVRSLLDKSVARFRSAHPKRTLDTSMTDLGDDATVKADPVLLRRVIDNLLDNAQKYTEDRSLPIALSARKDDAKHEIVIEVSDKGIGISKEDQKRLFEPFFRVDRSRTRATGGLGLGLVLARRVVEAHGGTLTIESDLGAGTRAIVRLPRA